MNSPDCPISRVRAGGVLSPHNLILSTSSWVSRSFGRSSSLVVHGAPAQAMGRFDDRADFVVGELLVESGLDVGEHAAGCHELDRVRTMADLAAHRAATFVHAVADSRPGLHASANVVAKPINLAVTASGRENGAEQRIRGPATFLSAMAARSAKTTSGLRAPTSRTVVKPAASVTAA